MRRTLSLAVEERNGELGDDQADGESRGGKPTLARRSPKVAPVKGKGHKLTIADDVFERLDLAAKRRKPPTTMSALANHILNLNLPTFEITEVKRAPPPPSEAPEHRSAGLAALVVLELVAGELEQGPCRVEMDVQRSKVSRTDGSDLPSNSTAGPETVCRRSELPAIAPADVRFDHFVTPCKAMSPYWYQSQPGDGCRELVARAARPGPDGHRPQLPRLRALQAHSHTTYDFIGTLPGQSFSQNMEGQIETAYQRDARKIARENWVLVYARAAR